jgi:hypothetical protein
MHQARLTVPAKIAAPPVTLLAMYLLNWTCRLPATRII